MNNPTLISRIAKLSHTALVKNRLDAVEPLCRLGQMLDPKAGVFHHHMGLAALITNDLEAALPRLTQAVNAFGAEDSPAALDANRDLIVAELMAEHGADAFEHAIAAERLWPQSAPLMRLLAQAAEMIGDTNTAADRYARALAATPNAHPDRAEIAFSLGTVLYNRHCLSAAYAAFRAAIDANPRHAKSWCNLGNTLSDMARPA
ncbi:MAG: hypothetical protein JXQ84_06860, partial [Rhodospirillaceae bacterium]|nr:hypothetical protein [Rhodospirillaceae bacterium]